MSFAGLFLKIFIIKSGSIPLFTHQLLIGIILPIFLKKTYKIRNLPNKGLTFVLKDDIFLAFRGSKMKNKDFHQKKVRQPTPPSCEKINEHHQSVKQKRQ